MSQPAPVPGAADDAPAIQEGTASGGQPAVAPEEAAFERSVQRISEQMWVAMRSGPSRDPFVEKMDAQHVHKVLDHSHTLEEHRLWATLAVVVLVVVAVFLLCWLFLAYGKSEHVDAVIALVVGLVGGFGAGAGWSKMRSE